MHQGRPRGASEEGGGRSEIRPDPKSLMRKKPEPEDETHQDKVADDDYSDSDIPWPWPHRRGN